MKKQEEERERLLSRTKFFLKEGQTLYVDPNGSGISPGLNRVFVTFKNGKVEIFADATSGSHFRFSRGSGEDGDPNFVIQNLGFKGALADFLEQKYWSQFNWGELIDYHEKKNAGFRRKITR
ncbi:MAG: hypothetical protein WDZ67_01970, partial [Patescibacteria group bacterium]